jgi:hypothetical protein
VTSSELNSGALSEIRLISEKGRSQMLDRKVENRGTNVKWRITTVLLTLWLLGEKVGRKKSSKSIPFQRGRRDSAPWAHPPPVADRWSFSGKQTAIQVLLERPSCSLSKRAMPPENQVSVVNLVGREYNGLPTQSQRAQHPFSGLIFGGWPVHLTMRFQSICLKTSTHRLKQFFPDC